MFSFNFHSSQGFFYLFVISSLHHCLFRNVFANSQMSQKQRVEWWSAGSKGLCKSGDVATRVQACNHMMNEFSESTVQHGDLANNTQLCT